MEQRIERILIASAVGVLGAMALGIKVVEGINSYLKYQMDGEPIMDTQTNGGVNA